MGLVRALLLLVVTLPSHHGEAEPKSTSRRGIGVTRSAIQSAFEGWAGGEMVFGSGRLLDGTPRALAYSNERDVLIRLVGPPGEPHPGHDECRAVGGWGSGFHR